VESQREKRKPEKHRKLPEPDRIRRTERSHWLRNKLSSLFNKLLLMARELPRMPRRRPMITMSVQSLQERIMKPSIRILSRLLRPTMKLRMTWRMHVIR